MEREKYIYQKNREGGGVRIFISLGSLFVLTIPERFCMAITPDLIMPDLLGFHLPALCVLSTPSRG